MLRILLLSVALSVALLAPQAAHASARAPLYFDAGSAAVEDATRDATLDRLADLGVRALRVQLIWARIAPDPSSPNRPAFDATDPNAYDWNGYGRLIDAAHARGWRVMVTFSSPVPRWATEARRDQVTRPKPTEFQAFATAAGRRFGTAVDAWGLWNEPNHPRFLQPQIAARKPVSPGIYRQLHRAGTRGLVAAGQGSDTMLGGETAPGGDRRRSVPALQFLRGVSCKGCATLRIDAWAHHPYAPRAGAAYRPPDRDNVTVGVLSRLTQQLDRLGHRRTPVWVTEFGVQSTPDTLLGVPLAQQARERSLDERILRGNPRVAAIAQYLLVDDVLVSGFQSGLIGADGAAKPSLDEFRLPLSARRDGSRVSLWGLVRPASGPTTVQIVVRDHGRVTATVRRRTDGFGAWTTRLLARAGRTFQARWTSPSGTTYVGPPTPTYG